MSTVAYAGELARIARLDVAKAQRRGYLIVCGTKRGHIAISYAGGVYKLQALGTLGNPPSLVAEGSRAEAVAALAPLYNVVSE